MSDNIFGTTPTSTLMSVAEAAAKVMQGQQPIEEQDESWLDTEARDVEHKWKRMNTKLRVKWLAQIKVKADKEDMGKEDLDDILSQYGLTKFDNEKIWDEAQKIKPKWKKMSTAKRTQWVDKMDALAVKARTSDADVQSILDDAGLKIKEEVEIDEGKFKKGDIVIPDMGPHKGEKHKIIHDFGDGSYNITPLMHPRNIKYKLGAAKAKENQLKLVKEEVEVEIDEIAPWKKGKYKVTDGKTGKVLGTFNSGEKAQKYVDKIWDEGDYDSLTVELGEEVVYTRGVEITEALKPLDKAVVDAFYYKKEKEGKVVSTDGDSLMKNGMGGQTIAQWLNPSGKIAISAVTDVKSTESILKYMKKSIPKGNFDKKSYKKFFGEELQRTAYELVSEARKKAVANKPKWEQE